MSDTESTPEKSTTPTSSGAKGGAAKSSAAKSSAAKSSTAKSGTAKTTAAKSSTAKKATTPPPPAAGSAAPPPPPAPPATPAPTPAAASAPPPPTGAPSAGAAPAYAPAAYAPPQPLAPGDEKTVAVLTHVGGILAGWLVPLITYLIFKDRSAFARQHTATALNFQLTVLIGYMISGVLMFLIIGFFTIFAVAILAVIFPIIAAVTASNGQPYRYPLTIPFVS